MSAKPTHTHDFQAVARALEGLSGADDPVASPEPIAGGPMVDAVLAEVLEHLRAVAAGEDDRRIVTLRGLPIGPEDYHALRAALGTGEARVEVRVGGLVEAQETSVSGVWWVKNCNPEGAVLAEEIEIATAPLILAADMGDIRAGAEALAQRLAARAAGQP
ncbi:MAG: hydrogenase expression/formation C-terminal domain-containing protein [Rubrimonas sp.]|uniref:hydrogenase expression/formation C-terminal domain-containing protein n=1 Tax=Rubrimonas sp. TaxID=2036015 RepID=UPI002FDE7BFF